MRETNLAYAALDHVLDDRGELARMFQDHHELDDRLKSVHATKNCSEARRLLKATIASAREHFRMEEEALFPFVEKTLAPESLEELGRYWVERNAEAIGTP